MHFVLQFVLYSHGNGLSHTNCRLLSVHPPGDGRLDNLYGILTCDLFTMSDTIQSPRSTYLAWCTQYQCTYTHFNCAPHTRVYIQGSRFQSFFISVFRRTNLSLTPRNPSAAYIYNTIQNTILDKTVKVNTMTQATFKYHRQARTHADIPIVKEEKGEE